MFGLAGASQITEPIGRGPVGPKLPEKGSIEVARICQC